MNRCLNPLANCERSYRLSASARGASPPMQTNRFTTLAKILALACALCQSQSAATFDILINHLGYDSRGSKNVVVQSAAEMELGQFQVLDGEGRVAFEGPLQKAGQVPGWQGRFYQQGDFSGLVKPGKYRRHHSGQSFGICIHPGTKAMRRVFWLNSIYQTQE